VYKIQLSKLSTAEVEQYQVDGVHISRPFKMTVVLQRKPQHDGDCQQSVH